MPVRTNRVCSGVRRLCPGCAWIVCLVSSRVCSCVLRVCAERDTARADPVRAIPGGDGRFRAETGYSGRGRGYSGPAHIGRALARGGAGVGAPAGGRAGLRGGGGRHRRRRRSSAAATLARYPRGHEGRALIGVPPRAAQRGGRARGGRCRAPERDEPPGRARTRLRTDAPVAPTHVDRTGTLLRRQCASPGALPCAGVGHRGRRQEATHTWPPTHVDRIRDTSALAVCLAGRSSVRGRVAGPDPRARVRSCGRGVPRGGGAGHAVTSHPREMIRATCRGGRRPCVTADRGMRVRTGRPTGGVGGGPSA